MNEILMSKEPSIKVAACPAVAGCRERGGLGGSRSRLLEEIVGNHDAPLLMSIVRPVVDRLLMIRESR